MLEKNGGACMHVNRLELAESDFYLLENVLMPTEINLHIGLNNFHGAAADN